MASKIVSKLVKPPIRLFGLEGSYVNALYSAASKKNQLNAVEGDLGFVSKLYTNEVRFRDFVTDPFVKPEQKVELFNKLKLNEVSVNFLGAMASYNRLKHLPNFERTFKKTMAATRRELPCNVTSAKPLTEAKKKELEDSLKGFTDKKLLITYEIDSALLGGLVVNFNNEHLIDMSIRSKVRSITSALQAT